MGSAHGRQRTTRRMPPAVPAAAHAASCPGSPVLATTCTPHQGVVGGGVSRFHPYLARFCSTCGVRGEADVNR